MVIIGNAHSDLLPNENGQHPTRKHDDKDNTPFAVKEIRDYDRQRLQHIQYRGFNVKIVWESNWNTLVEIGLKLIPTFRNFVPLLTLKRRSPKTKLFNIFETGTYLVLLNVTFTLLNI